MDKFEYLLTYSVEGKDLYKWFQTEKEMDEFIDKNDYVEVNLGIHIKDCEILRGFKRK